MGFDPFSLALIGSAVLGAGTSMDAQRKAKNQAEDASRQAEQQAQQAAQAQQQYQGTPVDSESDIGF